MHAAAEVKIMMARSCELLETRNTFGHVIQTQIPTMAVLNISVFGSYDKHTNMRMPEEVQTFPVMTGASSAV
jgi:hypothetical protein